MPQTLKQELRQPSIKLIFDDVGVGQSCLKEIIEALAECVACEAQYNTRKNMGFEYFQGYYFEKPEAQEFFRRLNTKPNPRRYLTNLSV